VLTHQGPKRNHAEDFPASAASDTKTTASLFHGLSEDDIAKILKSGTLRTFEKGHTIIRCGEPATHLYLIRSGSVNYYRVTPQGREVLLIRLGPGEAFGFGTIVGKPIGSIGSVETARESSVYVWEREWVSRWVREHPLLAVNALRIALEYIRLYSDRHIALVCDSAEHRLTRTLGLVGLRTGHQHAKGLEININNDQLASLADIGPFTASRLLSKWHRSGALEKSRGKIIIRSPEKMLA
jgi:CRP/FNR family transcriptional regulator